MDTKTADVAGVRIFYREAGDALPKTLIVWGRNDPLILPEAAEFSSHFALDENADAIADAIVETFSR